MPPSVIAKTIAFVAYAVAAGVDFVDSTDKAENFSFWLVAPDKRVTTSCAVWMLSVVYSTTATWDLSTIITCQKL